MDAELIQLAREAVTALQVQAAAFRKQGEALTQAFTQHGQALDRQGEVLAELLRRAA